MRTYTRGAKKVPEEWIGVDFTDLALVYKDANQHKAHKIILS